MDLSQHEMFFLEVNRKYNFLIDYGYNTGPFGIGGRESFVKYRNYSRRRQISLYWELGMYYFDVRVQKMGRFIWTEGRNAFELRHVGKIFGYKQLSVKIGDISFSDYLSLLDDGAKLLRTELRPVTAGELWIDELVSDLE